MRSSHCQAGRAGPLIGGSPTRTLAGRSSLAYSADYYLNEGALRCLRQSPKSLGNQHRMIGVRGTEIANFHGGLD